ncbi:homoserine kinase [Phormidium tenue FACHB-886]|nr:homoserine kinase [Phormidium tenue FACHB-886]
MLPSRVTVTVPATTANLGAGFDCIGAALGLYNRFQFSRSPAAADRPFVIRATGLEAEQVTTDESNLAYQAFLKLYRQIDQPPPPVQLEISLEVPLARGLGSSATAIVGGLVGANALANSPLSRAEVMQLAVAIEGHPDNVVPALIGGCRLAATNPSGTWTICDVLWHEALVPVIAIPDFKLSTAEARRVLPTTYSRADAVFNVAHLGLLLRGLETGNPDWLRTALDDRIHQPYRQALIQGYESVQRAALAAGAYGLVISGAGPTLLAIATEQEAVKVKTAMAEAWTAAGVSVRAQVLRLDSQGAAIETETA